MAEDRFIGMECPKCAKIHANTLDHLKAHWQETFTCENCGLNMKVDREELLAVEDGVAEGEQMVVKMTEAS